MKKYIEKANVLVEALPYIQKFYGRTIVIKYGGAAMADKKLNAGFAQDVVLMKFVGISPVIVHGGGPQIGELLSKVGVESKFIDGIRVTEPKAIDFVEMALVGKVNPEIVGLISRCGGDAVGLNGKDGGLIIARKYCGKRKEAGADETIDYGLVGEVKEINPEVIFGLDPKFVPVVAPLGVGEDGTTYNINSDTVAGRLASALKAEKLLLLSDVEGIMDRKGNLLSTLTASEAKELINQGVINGGMIPKVSCCLDAIKAGVKKVHIIDGRLKHSLLLELFTDSGIGTEILPED